MAAKGGIHKPERNDDLTLYKKKLVKFSGNIDNWYKKISEKKVGLIEEDDDFIQIDGSPNRFDKTVGRDISFEKMLDQIENQAS